MPGQINPICDNVRQQLVDAINEQISRKGWTQAEAAQRLGVSQPRISHLASGYVGRFSVDALFNLAARCGLQVEVTVKAPSPRNGDSVTA